MTYSPVTPQHRWLRIVRKGTGDDKRSTLQIRVFATRRYSRTLCIREVTREHGSCHFGPAHPVQDGEMDSHVAHYCLSLDIEPEDVDRVNLLAERSREGGFSADEEAELAAICTLATF